MRKVCVVESRTVLVSLHFYRLKLITSLYSEVNLERLKPHCYFRRLRNFRW